MHKITNQPLDLQLLLLMVLVSLPGIFFGIAGFLRSYWHHIRTHYPSFKKVNVLTSFLIINIFLILGAIITGIYLSASTNARYVFFMAIMNQKNLLQAFLFEFLPPLFIGFPAALIFLALYYYVLRPALDENSLFILEKMRNHMGLNVRIFYQSVIGEVVFRWGLQSFILWIILNLIEYGTISVILSILIASSLYATFHLFNLRIIKIQNKTDIAIRVWGLYFYSSLIFGIVFWKFGIFGAMVTHALFHIIWYPLDIFYYRKFPQD